VENGYLETKRCWGEIQNREYALCVVKKKVGSHIFRCDETKSWRNDLDDKSFTSVDPEIGIRRVATNKDNGQITKIWVIKT
jgi:hypothetical protein